MNSISNPLSVVLFFTTWQSTAQTNRHAALFHRIFHCPYFLPYCISICSMPRRLGWRWCLTSNSAFICPYDCLTLLHAQQLCGVSTGCGGNFGTIFANGCNDIAVNLKDGDWCDMSYTDDAEVDCSGGAA